MSIISLYLLLLKMDKEKYFNVCPNCGSTNVHPDLSKDMIAWGGSTRMSCGNCNFSSIVFPEVTKAGLKEFKEKIKQRSHTDKEELKKLSKSKGFTRKPFTKLYLYYFVLTWVAGIILFLYGILFDKDVDDLLFILIVITMLWFLFLVIKGLRGKYKNET